MIRNQSIGCEGSPSTAYSPEAVAFVSEYLPESLGRSGPERSGAAGVASAHGPAVHVPLAAVLSLLCIWSSWYLDMDRHFCCSLPVDSERAL